MRARGHRATTIEAKNGILRHLLHVPLVFTRLLHEALLAASAFTFYSEPAVLRDLPVLDHEQSTETSHCSREQAIRRVCIEAITQATAVARTNRALRTKTTSTGQHYYDEGDLFDYHRPKTTKDHREAGMARSQL
eukprot:5525189-Pyramimonas_sp.AAC.1